MRAIARCLKSAFVAALLVGGLGTSLQAQAVAANTQQVFYFTANCDDCANAIDRNDYPVTGTLVLQNYTPGTNIEFENFLSFSYGGSNLVDPYTVAKGAIPDFDKGIFNTDFATVAGKIASTAGPYRFELVFDDGLFFQSENTGDWSTCAPKDGGYYGGGSCFTLPPTPTDFGTAAVYSMAAPVPEPGAWAMLCAGLGLVAFMRRRRV
jgi:hypothetical protein